MGSNLSTSETSVFQSAVTKISQDIRNSSSNFNDQQVNIKQKIEISNTGIPRNSCDERIGLIVKCRPTCINNFKENVPNAFENPFINNLCENTCAQIQDCTEKERIAERILLAELPKIDCPGGLLVSNENTTTIGSTQIANTNTDAQMVSSIANQFESEIDKFINQTNKDLNLGQSNTSRERSNISQNVKNTISSSINADANNVSTQLSNTEQFIKIVNNGIIRGGSGPICNEPNTNCVPGCVISNNSATNLQASNNASSALNSIFNSDVVNDLHSKFKFSLTQTNAGINFNMFLILVIVIIVMVGVVLYGATRSPWVFALIVVLVLVGGGGVFSFFRTKTTKDLLDNKLPEDPRTDPNATWAIKNVETGKFCETVGVSKILTCDQENFFPNNKNFQFKITDERDDNIKIRSIASGKHLSDGPSNADLVESDRDGTNLKFKLENSDDISANQFFIKGEKDNFEHYCAPNSSKSNNVQCNVGKVDGAKYEFKKFS